MDASGDAVEIRRRMRSTPDKVFAAFADPGLVSRWLKPVPEVRLEVLSFDFRVGGAYRFAYHVPDGNIMHVNGVFNAIEPPTGLVFSWNIEPPDEHAGIKSGVTVAIAADGKGSEVLIRHEKLARVDAIERHQGGWIGALGLLDRLLAGETM